MVILVLVVVSFEEVYSASQADLTPVTLEETQAVSDTESENGSETSDMSNTSSASLQTSMLALFNRIRSILACSEGDLSNHIDNFQQSDNVPRVEGAENRLALKARARAVSRLIAQGKGWYDRYTKDQSYPFISTDEHALPKALHTEFLADGRALREEFVGKFDIIINQKESPDSLAGALDQLATSMKEFEEKINQLEEVKVLENARQLLEEVRNEMPQMEALFKVENLTQTQIETIRAHFNKLNAAHRVLSNYTKKLKHASWILFSSQHVAPVILSVAAATAASAAIAKVGPFVVGAAIAGSLLYEIYSVYHRARITQAITNKSLLKEMGGILLDDIRNTASYLKGASVNAIKRMVKAPETLAVFLLKRDHEQARRFLCAEIAEALKQGLEFLQIINSIVAQDLANTQISLIPIKARDGKTRIYCSVLDILAEYSVAPEAIKTSIFLQLRNALVSLLDSKSVETINIVDLLGVVLVEVKQDDQESKALRASAESIMRNLDLVSTPIQEKMYQIVQKIKASAEYQDRVRSLASQPLAGGDAQPAFMNEELTPAKIGKIEGLFNKLRRRKKKPTIEPEMPLIEKP